MPAILTLVALCLMPLTALAVDSPLTASQLNQIKAEMHEYDEYREGRKVNTQELADRLAAKISANQVLLGAVANNLPPLNQAILMRVLYSFRDTLKGTGLSAVQSDAIRDACNRMIYSLHRNLASEEPHSPSTP